MKRSLLIALCLVAASVSLSAESVYKLRPSDDNAEYFTGDGSGKTDVTLDLQAAIDRTKQNHNCGILFIPEGKYLISNTIYIPSSVRLIGYGAKRPQIILKDKAFAEPATRENSRGYIGERCPEARYMIFFAGNFPRGESRPSDASAGTFYSALSNIDLKIGKGNPYAVCVRSHYAQHSFVNHVDFEIGDGLAGVVEVGNESEDLRFFGGDYGVVAAGTSPGWPMVGVDYYFEGQKKAAIRSNDAIYTIINMTVRNVPVGVDCSAEFERLYLENCSFENVKEAVVKIGNPLCQINQFSLLDIYCKNAPVFALWPSSGKSLEAPSKIYKVSDFTYGVVQEDLAAGPEFKTSFSAEPLKALPSIERKIPFLPQMSTWINVRDFGAVGDGLADDTQAIRNAMASGDNIYFPCGKYRVSETLKMNEKTKFIGLHPFATQLAIGESTPAFSGFGGPVALLESSKGGENYLNGIGINTGAINYRAVGVKWMAGKDSFLNDVKFVGGHGTMSFGPLVDRPWRGGARQVSSPEHPIAAQGKDLAWDNQYWSLWVTDGGGGILKDIWTASSYATSGLYVSNTHTPTSVFCISLEHHVRSEARFDNVRNWKLYGFQTEEESREGLECQPVDMNNCADIMFAGTNTFRVIRVVTPWPYAFKVSNCSNIVFRNFRNYGQVKQPHNYALADLNSEQKILPWSFASATVKGSETASEFARPLFGKARRIATGFQFAEGLATDGEGNAYFLECLQRRIYRYSPVTGKMNLVTDLPYKPMELACDSEGRLLVVVRYDPQSGYAPDGRADDVRKLADENYDWSGWGNGGWGPLAYSIDPDDPDGTFEVLPCVESSSLESVAEACYPADRWRHDYLRAIAMVPERYFAAPDGKTYIPETHDLTRTASLVAAVPGTPYYTIDEEHKMVFRLDVDSAGRLSNPVATGIPAEFGIAVDPDGNIYAGMGDIRKYTPEGELLETITLPERPTALAFGGPEGKTLFVTTRESLFEISL